jgi:hypothetical protein
MTAAEPARLFAGPTQRPKGRLFQFHALFFLPAAHAVALEGY